jgi:ATP-dependent Clp protease adaptor protein ClpS
MSAMGDTQRDRRGEVLEKKREKTDKPRLFKVILHNDDYTTMDFVVVVLESMFNKSPAEAYRIMMHVHTRGAGIAGVYTHEVAETKVAMVHDRSSEAGYPLRASLEQE